MRIKLKVITLAAAAAAAGLLLLLVSACSLPDIDLPDPPEALTPNSSRLSVPFLVQRKDTQMLCLDGDPETGDLAWDRPHPDGVSGPHRSSYCARAAVTMINRFYGGSLSQDRVSYQIFKERSGDGPEGDLGHDTGFREIDMTPALAWALDISEGEIESFNARECLLDFSICTAPIDAGRPYLLTIDTDMPAAATVYDFEKGEIRTNHAVVVVGYVRANQPIGIPQTDPATGEETGLKEFNPDGPRLIVHDPGYATEMVDGQRYNPGRYQELPIRYLIWGRVRVPPANATGVEDEMDLGRGQPREYIEPGRCQPYPNRDTDGDCILDFDESERFETDPTNPDTDGDGVPDMLDLREYVYDGHRDQPDFDGDGNRKEVDPNNDDDCFLDGEEDVNLNGQRDDGETSNFEQERECVWYGEETVVITAAIEGIGAEEEYSGYIGFREFARTETESFITGGEEFVDFLPHSFGGNPGSIIAVEPSSPYFFGIVGFIKHSDEGSYLWLKKEPPDIMPVATVSSPAGVTTAFYPNPVGLPAIWYAVDPFGVYSGETFPQWVNDYDQIHIDPETNEVWLKLRIDDSDPANLTARWREDIRVAESRDGVTGTMTLSLDIFFWRGNRDRPE